MKRRASTADQRSSPFELRTLTGLPCGCVVADYRATVLDLELVSLEAKGPHCHLDGHRAEEVIGLGECGELDTWQLDALMVEQTAA